MEEKLKIHSLKNFFTDIKTNKKKKSKSRNHFQYSKDCSKNSKSRAQNMIVSNDV
jgi:hypothetical protein